MTLYEIAVLIVVGGLFVLLSLLPFWINTQDYDSLVQTKK